MIINFVQGIISYPTSGSLQAFLSKSGQYVNFVADNGNTDVTFAHGGTNYLQSESVSVPNAWGPLAANTNYWLYWDLNTTTAVRTFGFTTINPIYSAVKPTGVPEGQHWFNLATQRMNILQGGRWREVIRVFAAKVNNSTFTPLGTGYPATPFAGTQAGLVAENTEVGRIISDNVGNPIRRQDGRFFTSTDDFFLNGSPINSVRLESSIVTASAMTNMAKYQVVKFSSFDEILPATYNDTETTMIAMLLEDAIYGNTSTVCVQGAITNPDWNWTTVGQTLWIGAGGALVTTDPYITDPISNPVPKAPVGRVIAPQTIIFDQGLGMRGVKGDPGNASSQLATTTVFGNVRLTVPAASSLDPVVVGDNDPRNSNARTPLPHTHTLAASLTDVVITAPAVDNVLKYDGTKWVNGTGGGGSAEDLGDLGDVTLSEGGEGQALVYNGTEWINDYPLSIAHDASEVVNVGRVRFRGGLNVDTSSIDPASGDEIAVAFVELRPTTINVTTGGVESGDATFDAITSPYTLQSYMWEGSTVRVYNEDGEGVLTVNAPFWPSHDQFLVIDVLNAGEGIEIRDPDSQLLATIPPDATGAFTVRATNIVSPSVVQNLRVEWPYEDGTAGGDFPLELNNEYALWETTRVNPHTDSFWSDVDQLWRFDEPDQYLGGPSNSYLIKANTGQLWTTTDSTDGTYQTGSQFKYGPQGGRMSLYISSYGEVENKMPLSSAASSTFSAELSFLVTTEDFFDGGDGSNNLARLYFGPTTGEEYYIDLTFVKSSYNPSDYLIRFTTSWTPPSGSSEIEIASIQLDTWQEINFQLTPTASGRAVSVYIGTAFSSFRYAQFLLPTAEVADMYQRFSFPGQNTELGNMGVIGAYFDELRLTRVARYVDGSGYSPTSFYWPGYWSYPVNGETETLKSGIVATGDFDGGYMDLMFNDVDILTSRSSINRLADVDAGSPNHGDVLTYNDDNGKWEPQSAGGSSPSPAVIRLTASGVTMGDGSYFNSWSVDRLLMPGGFEPGFYSQDLTIPQGTLFKVEIAVTVELSGDGRLIDGLWTYGTHIEEGFNSNASLSFISGQRSMHTTFGTTGAANSMGSGTQTFPPNLFTFTDVYIVGNGNTSNTATMKFDFYSGRDSSVSVTKTGDIGMSLIVTPLGSYQES